MASWGKWLHEVVSARGESYAAGWCDRYWIGTWRKRIWPWLYQYYLCRWWKYFKINEYIKKIYEKAFQDVDGVKIVYDRDILETIVDKSTEEKAGASGLKRVVDDSYDIEIGYDLSSKLVSDIEKGLVGKIRKFAVITDSNVKDLYAKPISVQMVLIEFKYIHKKK